MGNATFGYSVGGNQCLTLGGIVGDGVLCDSQDKTHRGLSSLQISNYDSAICMTLHKSS